MKMKLRLVIMLFLQYAVWGAYLTSMGAFLANVGQAQHIGLFYATQGFVSLFMPAVIGILADRWLPAQKMLGLCHMLAGFFMMCAAYFGSQSPVSFGSIYTFYLLSVALYMPTIALANSVSYTALHSVNLDPVQAFPPLRIWGTVGFICTMLVSNFTGFQNTYAQWYLSGALGLVLGLYSFTLPNCPVSQSGEKKSFAQALGLDAFKLFKQKKMAVFFIFSMLLGSCLQITNGYANPFINSYNSLEGLAGSWGASNANALISLSQLSETFCILLIPFFLKRYGIKKVMLISMFAWVLRFGLFGVGNPVTITGISMLVLSMIVYGVAFDFFNVSARCLWKRKRPFHPLQRAGAVYADDQRHRRHHRHAGRAGNHQPLCLCPAKRLHRRARRAGTRSGVSGGRVAGHSVGLGLVLVYLRRVCAGYRHCVCVYL